VISKFHVSLAWPAVRSLGGGQSREFLDRQLFRSSRLGDVGAFEDPSLDQPRAIGAASFVVDRRRADDLEEVGFADE